LIWNFLFLFKKESTNSIYLKRFTSKFLSLFEKPYTLILSNDCGGGSESYLNVLIEENRPHNYILKYNLKKGYFYCHSERSEESRKLFLKPLLSGFFAPLRMTNKNSHCHSEHSHCHSERIEESHYYFSKYLQNKAYKTLLENAEQIIINNIAFFPKPLQITEQIVQQKKENQKVIFVVNDYFSVCPSFFLLNYAGKYCSIPEIELCRKCLKQNNLDYIVNIERDIENWRNTWQNFLMNCDEIRVFSESSVELMKKAYPNIALRITRVKPEYSKLFSKDNKEIKNNYTYNKDKLKTIAIAGTLNYPKGSSIVKELAKKIEKSYSDKLRIVVIGEMLVDFYMSKSLIVTGRYRREDLANITKQYNVNSFLFPSICPETYSIVCDEIMEMGYPLAVFNFGAQKEKAAKYEKGIVLKEIEIEYIISKLLNL